MLSQPLQERLFTATPTLETERLVLRAFSLADAPDLLRLCSDPRVAEHQEWTPLAHLAEATHFIEERLELFRRRVRLSFAIALQPCGPLIGQAGLHSISLRDRRAELAFELRSDHWRRGLMREALRALLMFAFEHAKLEKVVAQAVVENDACHALLLASGFVVEGRLRAHHYFKQRFHDVHLYGLRREAAR